MHSPDFTLAAETVFTANTEFLIKTLTLIRATGSTESKTIYTLVRNGHICLGKAFPQNELEMKTIMTIRKKEQLLTVSVMSTSNHCRESIILDLFSGGFIWFVEVETPRWNLNSVWCVDISRCIPISKYVESYTSNKHETEVYHDTKVIYKRMDYF